MLSRLDSRVGDTSADVLSDAEFEESPRKSPLAFGTFKLVAGALCRQWHAGFLIDRIGSLHRSAGGLAALRIANTSHALHGCSSHCLFQHASSHYRSCDFVAVFAISANLAC